MLVHRDPSHPTLNAERLYRGCSHCVWKVKGRQIAWLQYVYLFFACVYPALTSLTLTFTVSPIKLRRQKLTYITGASLSIPSYELKKDPQLLRGLPSELVPIPEGAAHEGTDSEGPYSEIVVPDTFPPGSMMVFATSMSGLDPKLDSLCSSGASEAFADLDLVDLNVLLHRADGEERDATGLSQFCRSLDILGWVC